MVTGQPSNNFHFVLKFFKLLVLLIDLSVQLFDLIGIMLLHCDVVFFHLINFEAELRNFITFVLLL